MQFFAHRRRYLLAALATASIAAAAPVAASASTTLGSSLAFNGGAYSLMPCSPLCTLIPTADGTNPVISPIDGVIVRWGTSPSDIDTTTARLRVLRANSTPPIDWIGVRTGPTEMFTTTVMTTHTNFFFDLNPGLPISKDDYIGMDTSSLSGDATTARPITGSSFDYFTSPLAEGGSGQSGTTTPDVAVYLQATVEPDADGDRFGDETQDKCPAVAAPGNGCPPAVAAPSAAALSPVRRKCKKHRKLRRGRCVKKKRRA
jgi:hypothetical protein